MARREKDFIDCDRVGGLNYKEWTIALHLLFQFMVGVIIKLLMKKHEYLR